MENNELLDQQLKQPEQVEQIQEQKAEDVQQQNAQQAKESDKDLNITALRSARDRAERERDQAFRILKQMEEARKQAAPEDEPFSISPDDYVEGKHLSRYENKLKKLEEKVNQYEQQARVLSAENQLRSRFSDFDSVVSKDNVELLKDRYPEIANTLMANHDMYDKGVSAYTLIKNLGIAETTSSFGEREALARNKTKPRTSASLSPQQSDSPLTRANAFANGLTDDLKSQLWKEMQEAINNKAS